MRVLRAVARLLDLWSALLLGALLALGVVILLATPGPWHHVVGPPPAVKSQPSSPGNVAVFVLGGGGARCSGVVWLHIDHDVPSLTATVLPPDSQVFVSRGGFAPLRHIVRDVGPRAAAGALAETLGLELDAWAVVDRRALRLALEAMSSVSPGHAGAREYRRATAAWEGRGRSSTVLPAQYRTLGLALPRTSYGDINIVAFVNYLLGFGHVSSDLDSQGATSLARALKALKPADVHVRAAAAVVETCRGADSWRLDRVALGRLRRALEAGKTPPPSAPRVRRVERPARVLVVAPGKAGAEAYVAEVRLRLRRSAGAPVAVRSVIATGAGDPLERVRAQVRRWRPLAVLVAPLLSAPSSAGVARTAATLRSLGDLLRRGGWPAVMSGPLPLQTGNVVSPEPDPGALDAAVAASGLPVSDLAILQEPAGTTPAPVGQGARAAARANVQTLVRVCWPGTLSPGLASTRLAFGFAACRRTEVAVLASSDFLAERTAAALRLWGYAARPGVVAALPEGGVTTVAYREGMRRAALALAGDLGLGQTAVVADDGAPAAVTLELQK